jgi:hypothetical protein
VRAAAGWEGGWEGGDEYSGGVKLPQGDCVVLRAWLRLTGAAATAVWSRARVLVCA